MVVGQRAEDYVGAIEGVHSQVVAVPAWILKVR